MDFAALRIFVTVVEEGGVAKAARRLHRVQSNVTTRIKQLEQAIGSELFVRDGRRLVLSLKGQQLLGYATKILRLAEEARTAISDITPSGTLRLGALESTSASRLPNVLARYHSAYPEVRIELLAGTNDHLVDAVAQRRVDAAFVVDSPTGETFAAMPLFAERLAVIASEQHAPIRRPSDVEADSIVTFPNGCAYRRILQRWLGRNTLASVRVLELSSYHAIVACVAAGAGIALVPESVLDTVRHKGVARYAIPRIYGSVTTPLIWRRDIDPHPALHALRQLLLANRRELGLHASVRKVPLH